jgi:hypothetical protein
MSVTESSTHRGRSGSSTVWGKRDSKLNLTDALGDVSYSQSCSSSIMPCARKRETGACSSIMTEGPVWGPWTHQKIRNSGCTNECTHVIKLDQSSAAQRPQRLSLEKDGFVGENKTQKRLQTFLSSPTRRVTDGLHESPSLPESLQFHTSFMCFQN